MGKKQAILLFVISAILITITFNTAFAGEELRINRIIPAGEDVQADRQIVITFNRDVVPLGRMERTEEEVGITISPKVECQWRWINRNSLACQLGEKEELKKSTKYNITIYPKIAAEDGQKIAEIYKHSFITPRPVIINASFRQWNTPHNPRIAVTFNQGVTTESVAKHLFFEYHDGRKYQRIATKLEKPKDVGENIWLVSPVSDLPADMQFYLEEEPGIESKEGAQRSIKEGTLQKLHSFPEFEFLGISCYNNRDNKKTTKSDAAHKCNPAGNAYLEFSSPVLFSQIKEHVKIYKITQDGQKQLLEWDDRRDYSRVERRRNSSITYYALTPGRLDAVTKYHIEVDGEITDEFDRHLPEVQKMAFRTDHYKPNLYINHDTSVLESQIDSDMPLQVVNLDKVTANYTAITASGEESKNRFVINDGNIARDAIIAIPAQIKQMLGGKSGVVQGYIKRFPSTKGFISSLFDPYKGEEFLSIVSPYHVHVKLGHYNSLVWVTDLQTGEAVSDARVRIYYDDKEKISAIADDDEGVMSGKTGADGIAMLKGRQDINDSPSGKTLFVRIDKGDDIAIMPLDYDFEVDMYRISGQSFWSYNRDPYGHIKSWGMTAQGLYRAGEKMQYKIYLRNQDNNRLTPPPAGEYTLEIRDPMNKVVHKEEGVKLSKFGSFSGEYLIPKNAMTGWYDFRLESDLYDLSWSPMQVLVSDFTPSPFKVESNINGDLFHPGDEMEIETLAKLHSGGAFTGAQARITARLKSAYFSPSHPVVKGFEFDTYKKYNTNTILQKIADLGDDGKYIHKLEIPQEDIIYGRIDIESAVRDDRGKYIASSAGAKYIAVDRLVGLKSTKWLYEQGKQEKLQYIVVDEQGNPTEGTNVDIVIERLQTKASRVKGAGNTYETKYIDEWIKEDSCNGAAGIGALDCAFMPRSSGTYRAVAKIKDTHGKPHETEMRMWVAGKDAVVWQSGDDNSLQIIPERTDYKVGDRARYLIKNPYPGAPALISIERFGVMKHWTQLLEGSTPVIEFDVEEDMLPGFYLSVTVASPRVAAPMPEVGQVDMGKPSIRAGYIKTVVSDPYKQLDIDIKTDKEVYKPGDIVTATISAKPKYKEKEPVEIAVIVLDEAVLDLVQGGKGYFDPYKGFYQLDSLDLDNYNLLLKLIGRQKFEKKGATPGGGGGKDDSVRSNFKGVAHFRGEMVLNEKGLDMAPAPAPRTQAQKLEEADAPQIREDIANSAHYDENAYVDKDGNGVIKFKLPDNLTGWRVLVVGVTPGDRMGLGDSNFKVNLPTELRPVMPNQVSEGDIFHAGFSVMNRTDKARDIRLVVNMQGDVAQDIATLSKEFFKLKPYERKTIYLPVKAAKIDADKQEGEITFNVIAGDDEDEDALRHTLKVNKLRALDVAADYGSTIADKESVSLAFPQGIHSDIGDVSLTLSTSVIGNVEGAFEYMQNYPYLCWEQKLSKATMASHYGALKEYLPQSLIWDGAAALPEDTLAQAADFQAPNGGMAYFIASNERVSPYLSAYTALAFNWMRERGQTPPQAVEKKLHVYLQELLKKDAMPEFYSSGMASTVRAVALAALAPHGKVSMSDIERYKPHMKQMSLFGKAHFLQAANAVSGGQHVAEETAREILNHSVQSGGKFSFNEQIDGAYARILATPMRANCAILSAFAHYAKTDEGRKLADDVPMKLARSITQSRGKKAHFSNTQENIFCMNALADYSAAYENVTPKMEITADIDNRPMGQARFDSLTDAPVTMHRPITSDDIGKKRRLDISRAGDGRLYYTTRMSYAPLAANDNRTNAGIDIRKEYSVERDGQWVLLDTKSQVKRGELVRVDIYLSTPTARNFVVVDDPIPGGLEPVNRDLATASIVDADKAGGAYAGGSWWFRHDGWRDFNMSFWSFYHKELRHDAARFYSDYLPAGNYHLSYTAQAIAEGEFAKPPVHAHEMYDPDIYGRGLNGTLYVTGE